MSRISASVLSICLSFCSGRVALRAVAMAMNACQNVVSFLPRPFVVDADLLATIEADAGARHWHRLLTRRAAGDGHLLILL